MFTHLVVWKVDYLISEISKIIQYFITAIIEDVDILVTGDKDFSDIDVEKPKIMSPTQFMENF